VALLDGGATVPFGCAFTRKEITGALDDAQLRTLEERLNYPGASWKKRRLTILNFRPRAGQAGCRTRSGNSGGRQQRSSRRHLSSVQARNARNQGQRSPKNAGLEPLGQTFLLTQPENDPQAVVATVHQWPTRQVVDAVAALDGAAAANSGRTASPRTLT